METNLAIEIIDEVMEEKSGNEGFIIDNDEKAEWALRKIAEERAEADRFISVCKAMITEYENKIGRIQDKLKSKTSFLEGQLQRYFESVSRKKTKTHESYTLPSGTLKLKLQQPEFKRNDDLLLKWLKDNCMTEYVKTEEKPNWGELKKKVILSGDKVLSEDGQIIDGVEVLERPNIFEIDI